MERGGTSCWKLEICFRVDHSVNKVIRIFSQNFHEVIFSFADIISDYWVSFGQYLIKEYTPQNETVTWDLEKIKDFDKSVEVMWVKLYSKKCIQEPYGLSCWKYDPIYGILTFTYINLPGAYMLSCFIGPLSAGIFGGIWGITLIIIGKIIGVLFEECHLFQMALYSHSLGILIISFTQALNLIWKILHKSVKAPKVVTVVKIIIFTFVSRVLEKTARELSVFWKGNGWFWCSILSWSY